MHPDWQSRRRAKASESQEAKSKKLLIKSIQMALPEAFLGGMIQDEIQDEIPLNIVAIPEGYRLFFGQEIGGIQDKIGVCGSCVVERRA